MACEAGGARSALRDLKTKLAMGTNISTPTPGFGRNHKLGKEVELASLAKYTRIYTKYIQNMYNSYKMAA